MKGRTNADRGGRRDWLARPESRLVTLPVPARYAIAVLAAAAGILLRLAFDPLFGTTLPYITMFPAIMLSAWLGGFGPGLLTLLISTAAADYYWIEPIRSWAVDDKSELVGLLMFIVVGALISGLNEAWRRAEHERAALLARERKTRNELEQASLMKDEFLAALSHELRTPLNAVLGYAQLLRTGRLPPDQAAHAIHAIERNAQAQARLVESLLDLSRVIAGTLELTVAELQLPSLLDAAVDVVRPDADRKRIAIEVSAPSISLAADGSRLQQVFWNLLTNAVKFTPRGGHIQVRASQVGDQVRIEVADNGQGISADFLPRVFDRFRQEGAEGGGSLAGLGLGLSLVREMVHAHGGTIEATSPGPGQGSTFIMTLPLTARARPGGSSAERRAAGAEPPARALDVLIVDDDADGRELLALMIESWGGLARAVASAAEALRAIEARRPDLLLADLRMPGEDGFSLIRTIRTREIEQRGARLPALAVTAQAGPADRDRALAAGYDGHIPKPVEPDVLSRAIAAAMKDAPIAK